MIRQRAGLSRQLFSRVALKITHILRKGGEFFVHPLCFFIVILLAAFILRLWMLQDMAARALDCRWCVIPGALKADVPFFCMLGLLFLFSCWSNRRLWFVPLRIAAIAGLFVYIADIVVMSQFATRLYLDYVFIYLAQFDVVLNYFLNFPLWWIIITIAGLSGLTILCLCRAGNSLQLRIVAVAAAVFLAIGVVFNSIPVSTYVHNWAVRNVLAINLDSGVARDYSLETRQIVGNSQARPEQCVPGRGYRGHVVLLILESWSTYHSKYWSGLNDWSPQLDSLAKESMHFTRMHAGGYNTNEGLISLFTGLDFVLPIKPAHRFEPFDTAWGLDDTLPRKLDEQGYDSAFLTSGNLAFTRKGEWLADIGFAYIEGHNYPGYDGIFRNHFDAVPDDVLYERALEFILKQSKSEFPAFIVVENVSTHHPYQHPYTQERSEEAVFRFMDETAAHFINSLEEQGFFENGLLVVMSDHRAMTMVSASEENLFGRAASSLIQAFIMTRDRTGLKVDDVFHQSDLMAGLMTQVSDEYCHQGVVRDMFVPENTEPRCVIHARGDQRGHLDVFCEKGEGTVAVAGDDSYFVDQIGLDHDLQDRILKIIAHGRIILDR